MADSWQFRLEKFLQEADHSSSLFFGTFIMLLMKPEYMLSVLSGIALVLILIEPQSIFRPLTRKKTKLQDTGELDPSLAKALAAVQDFIEEDDRKDLRRACQNINNVFRFARAAESKVMQAPQLASTKLHLM